MLGQTKIRKPSFKGAFKQTFSSLSVRNYRLFIIGQGISLCGTWAQMIAMGWLVLELTHSGTQLGLVVAAQFLPILLFGMWGGVIADRFNKRRVLFFTQSVAAVLALVLGVLVMADLIQLWMVYILAAGAGLVQALDAPTRQSFLIEMVGRDRLKNAVTLNSVTVNIGRIIGPTIAGFLIVLVGIGQCFLVNAATFVAVLIALKLMDTTQLHTVPPVLKEKGQVRAGLKYAWSVPKIRAVLVMMLIVGTLAYEFPVVLPLLATETFKGDVSTYSALTALMSLGATVGGLYVAGRGEATMRTVLRVTVLFGLSMILLAFVPNVASALAVLFLVGVLSIMFISLTNSTLQLTTAPEMRGRVMSMLAVSFLGTTPIGGPIIGYVSDHAGPRFGLLVGGAATVLAAAIGRHASKSTVA